MQRVAVNDEAALRLLQTRFVSFLRAYAVDSLPPASLDDYVQTCLIDLWRNALRFNPSKGALVTWVRAVARNKLRDHLRSRNRKVFRHTQSLEELPFAAHPYTPLSPSFAAFPDISPSQLRAALNSLSAQEQETLYLHYAHNHSLETISRIRKVPLGTVKTNITRGRKRLAEAFPRLLLTEAASTIAKIPRA